MSWNNSSVSWAKQTICKVTKPSDKHMKLKTGLFPSAHQQLTLWRWLVLTWRQWYEKFEINRRVGWRGQLWLRGRASIFLSESRWFRFPWSAYQSVLGQETEPQNAYVLVGTLHGSHRHQCMNVCMNYCKSLWTEESDEWPKCKCFSYVLGKFFMS